MYYIVVLFLAPLVEKHWRKGRSSSISFLINLLGIPDLSDVFVKKKKNSFSFIWFHGICWFFIYLNTAWRRIAADIKVKVKRAWRLQAI